MKKTIEQICTDDFFIAFGAAVAGDAGQYISHDAIELQLFFRVEYYDFPVVDPFNVPNPNIADIATYLGMMYSTSLNRIYRANTQEYDPLSNTYSRETEKYSGTDTNTGTRNGTSELNNSLSESGSTTYDSTAYKPVNKTSGNANSTENQTYNDSFTHGKTIERERDGNIGVVSVQTMINQEFALRLKFNMYHVIAAIIIRELCTGVLYGGDE